MTGSVYGLTPKGLNQALSIAHSGLGETPQIDSGVSKRNDRQQPHPIKNTVSKPFDQSQRSKPHPRQETEASLLGGLSAANASLIARRPHSTAWLSAVSERLFNLVEREGKPSQQYEAHAQESTNTELNKMLPQLISSLQAMGYEGVETIRLGNDSKGQLEIFVQNTNPEASENDGKQNDSEEMLEPHPQAEEILNMLTHVNDAGQRLAKIIQPVSFLDVESGRLELGEIGFASNRTAALGFNTNFSS